MSLLGAESSWLNAVNGPSDQSRWALDDAGEFSDGTVLTLSNKSNSFCRLLTPLDGSEWKSSWMMMARGEGRFIYRWFGEGHQTSLAFEMVAGSTIEWNVTLTQEDADSSDPQVKKINLPLGQWSLLECVRTGSRMELRILGEMVHAWKISVPSLSFSFRSYGNMFLNVDEFKFEELDKESSRLDSISLTHGGPLPQDWNVEGGTWSVLKLPKSDQVVLSQSAKAFGQMTFSHPLTEGMSFSADVRLEREGKVGLVFIGKDHQVIGRYMIQLSETKGLVFENSLAKPLISFNRPFHVRSSLWYRLKVEMGKNGLKFFFNEQLLDMFPLTDALTPALMSEGADLALFKNVFVKKSEEEEVSLSVPLAKPLVRSGGWVSEVKLPLLGLKDRVSFDGVKMEVNERVWSFSSRWVPLSSTHLCVGFQSLNEYFFVHFLKESEAWKCAIVVNDEFAVPEIEWPMGLSRFPVSNSEKLIHVESLANSLGRESFEWSFSRLPKSKLGKEFEVMVNGQAMGPFAFLRDKNLRMSLGSDKNSEVFNASFISTESKISNEKIDLNFVDSKGIPYPLLGGGFNDLSLDGDKGFIELGLPFLEGSSLSYELSSRKNGGIIDLRFLTSLGVPACSVSVDLREANSVSFDRDGEGRRIEAFVAGARVTWSREGTKIFLLYGEKLIFQWNMEDRQELLFLQTIPKSGDFNVTDIQYKWSQSKKITFRNDRLKHRNELVWKSEGSVDRHPSNATLRKKLQGDFDVWLLSETEVKGRSNKKLKLSSDDVKIELAFAYLEGGGEVTLSLDGNVVSRRNFYINGKDVYVGMKNDILTILVNGQLLFQKPLTVGQQRWELSLDSGDPKVPHPWIHALWRMR